MATVKFNSDLKRIQIQYDEKITLMIENLQNHSVKRQFDFKECEELARNSGRMNLRWRKMTSMTQEALMEFDNENKQDNIKIDNLKSSLNETIQRYELAKANNEQLTNLIAILEQVATKIESKRNN